MSTATGPIRHEAMRIGGRKITSDGVIEVTYPYTGAVIGTVPAGTPAHVAEAFEIAARYKPTLTRHARQQILLRAAALSARPARRDRALDHAGAGHQQTARAL